MTHPTTMDEFQTLDEMLKGRSVARFGDGELRLALGQSIRCQKAHLKLQRELEHILGVDGPELCCIPNPESPNEVWAKYRVEEFTDLYKRSEYGSAFITRPDSAPWIDVPYYWGGIRKLWRNKRVTLVVGDRRSLREEDLTAAANIRVVRGPVVDAYEEIDKIERDIGLDYDGVVLMCLGPTATVLAHRLAKKGVTAYDLGHIGMFMRYAGERSLVNNKEIYELVKLEGESL